jgi:SRSO17 transposase
MGLPRSSGGEARFSTYVEGLTSVIGHADRAKPLRDYCLGLMMPCGRKSVEPMAAITAPERTAAQHQSLLHFAGEGKWSDEKVLAKVDENMPLLTFDQLACIEPVRINAGPPFSALFTRSAFSRHSTYSA